jgi:hypothetical protein
VSPCSRHRLVRSSGRPGSEPHAAATPSSMMISRRFHKRKCIKVSRREQMEQTGMPRQESYSITSSAASEPKRLGGLEIDDQLEPGGSVDRQISRFDHL